MTDKNLQRGLSNRHIQLIALGSAVGTGLFLGVASSVAIAGPAVILGYAIAGLMAFLMMRQLGEMAVDEPVAGSFSHFAHRYWGALPGFLSGWNYWILYILVGMAELTAIGKYVQYWLPDIPVWVISAFFFVLINAINLMHVRFFGEAEFWFAIIKIVAILAMIVFGAYLLFADKAGPQAGIDNLWKDGGFLPFGVEGLMMSMAVIMFSFGGLEMIGLTAAEAKDPAKTIPKATNQVIYRILIFYIGALAILFSLYPWREISEGASPFVLIFASLQTDLSFSLFGHQFQITNLLSHVLNLVVLTAAISVYNSCVYANSRMLYGLAKQKDAPAFLAELKANSAPKNAIYLSSLLTFICIAVNYFMPAQALGYFMSLAVAAMMMNWLFITITHLRFRQRKQQQGLVTQFPSLLYPFANYLCCLFILVIIIIMWLNGMHLAVLLMPISLVVLSVIYFVVKKKRAN